MSWLRTREALDYLVLCYSGTEDRGNIRRRQFLWEHGTEIRLGNIEAFADHMIERFASGYGQRRAVVTIHAILRELGEPAGTPRQGRAPASKVRGTKRPEPEWKVVGKCPA